MKKILVTGSSGLIGSEVCQYFADQNLSIDGLDNNNRAVFFGTDGDTRWNQNRLSRELNNFTHHEIDICDREAVLNCIKQLRPDIIVHTAAQPSHDKAASIPFEDFDVNAVGTFNLLEACRRFCKDTPFIHMSTNKVYGDKPNNIKLKELDSRYDYDDNMYMNGIPETMSIDQCTHSLFGASKVAADVVVQEYGRYFDMPTCCLRGGCLTGPSHSGVELHGFLSYLTKCNFTKKQYKIFGYKGKQVRDNIHSFDVANFIWQFAINPRKGEVYNIGGGRSNSCSIIEAFEIAEKMTGNKMIYTYTDESRIGDHICYYSDLSKIKTHYPKWKITKSLNDIFQESFDSWSARA